MIGWHGQTLFVHAELANVFYKSQIVTLLSIQLQIEKIEKD